MLGAEKMFDFYGGSVNAAQIYLDHNASTPIDPSVRAAMAPYLAAAFGTPSSSHWAGAPAREAVETARAQVAALLGCAPDEIVFTSGGTEANNEVGTIQPIADIARITREAGVPLHSDAVQTVGKLDTDVDASGVDLLSMAAHKFNGPKGVGALYVRRGVRLEPFVHGASHESGRRAGTENVVLDVGLGAAAALARDRTWTNAVRELRDRFWVALRERFGDRVRLNGHPTERLCNTLNVAFVGRVGRDILAALPGVAASTSSAPVLAAMQVSPEAGMGAVRFSLGRSTRREELDAVAGGLASALA